MTCVFAVGIGLTTDGFSGDVTDSFNANNQAAIDDDARRVWGLTEKHVYYVDSQFNHDWGNHTVSYGIQYRYEDLTDGSLYDAANTPTTDDRFSNRLIGPPTKAFSSL